MERRQSEQMAGFPRASLRLHDFFWTDTFQESGAGDSRFRDVVYVEDLYASWDGFRDLCRGYIPLGRPFERDVASEGVQLYVVELRAGATGERIFLR